jgi:hypothetical protein
MIVKYVKSQKTGKYVEIGPKDMDYNTRFALTEDELRAEKKIISEALDMVDMEFNFEKDGV